jgi:hypothetical protein
LTTRRSTSALPRVKPAPEPETLPRFRSEESAPLPSFELDDESGPRGRAANDSLPGAADEAITEEPFAFTEEPFDAAPTRLRSTPAAIDPAAFFEVAPTKVRPRAVRDGAALDDVLEELRAATGHAPVARELSTSDLKDADESLEIEVDESELVEMRRPAPTQDVWNVHAAHPHRAPMVTVRVERPRPKSRVPALLTASFFGAAIAAGVVALFLLRMPVLAPPARAATPAAATPEAPPVDGIATKGTLKLPAAARGQRVLLDEDVLDAKDAQLVACGVHSLRIGSAPWTEIDVPCGGELSVR